MDPKGERLWHVNLNSRQVPVMIRRDEAAGRYELFVDGVPEPVQGDNAPESVVVLRFAVLGQPASIFAVRTSRGITYDLELAGQEVAPTQMAAAMPPAPAPQTPPALAFNPRPLASPPATAPLGPGVRATEIGRASPPVPTAQQQGLPVATRVGPKVGLRVEARLPGICFKCGTEQDVVRRETTFDYTSRRNNIASLVGYLLTQQVRSKWTTATMKIPLCRACDRNWTLSGFVFAILIVLSICLPFLFGYVANLSSVKLSPEKGITVFLILLFLGIPTLIFMSRALIRRPMILWAEDMDVRENMIYLAGIHPKAVSVLLRYRSR